MFGKIKSGILKNISILTARKMGYLHKKGRGFPGLYPLFSNIAIIWMVHRFCEKSSLVLCNKNNTFNYFIHLSFHLCSCIVFQTSIGSYLFSNLLPRIFGKYLANHRFASTMQSTKEDTEVSRSKIIHLTRPIKTSIITI